MSGTNQQPTQEPEPQDWDSPEENNYVDENNNERRRVTLQSLPAYHEDKQFYKLVVMFLGTTILMCTAGAFILSCFEKTIPDIAVALGSAAVGALAGLFSPGKQ